MPSPREMNTEHQRNIEAYFTERGERGDSLRGAIDAYRSFADALDHRNRLRIARGRSLVKYDPYAGQGRILAELAQTEGLSQVQLAEKLGVTPQTISTAIRKLEREGLVKRTPDPLDARTRRVALTERGSEEKARLDTQEQYSGSVFETLSEEELLQFTSLMEKLTVRLKQEIATENAEEGAIPKRRDVASFPITQGSSPDTL